MYDQFPITSRYRGIEIAIRETADGQPIAYLRRRFLPSSASLALLYEHTVTQGERLDNIAAEHLGDPEQFWRLCDANNAIAPDDLTQEVGRKLRITLPKGVPGARNA